MSKLRGMLSRSSKAAIARLRDAWPRADKSAAFQICCAFSALYGISYWSVPCALVVGGIAGFVGMEVRAR